MKRTFLATLALGAIWISTAPAATIYTNRSTFENALGTRITDDYSTAYPAGFNVFSNAAMSAFLGETDYESTYYGTVNVVFAGSYCAGCNGSFRLTFTSTSVTGTNGVFGAGLDIVASDGSYTALVTYGDNSTEEFTTPGVGQFWGIASSLEIQSIHFAFPGGVATPNGYFQIDNLTIGDEGQVPEPATWAITGMGLAGLVFLRGRRQAG